MFAKLRYLPLRVILFTYLINEWINSYKIVSETGFKQLNLHSLNYSPLKPGYRLNRDDHAYPDISFSSPITRYFQTRDRFTLIERAAIVRFHHRRSMIQTQIRNHLKTIEYIYETLIVARHVYAEIIIDINESKNRNHLERMVNTIFLVQFIYKMERWREIYERISSNFKLGLEEILMNIESLSLLLLSSTINFVLNYF